MKMDAKIIIIALLACSLLFFGCAKKGETSTAPIAPSGGVQNQTQNATHDGQAAGGNASGQDLGNLFNIDTAQPDSGSGYNVPAAGE